MLSPFENIMNLIKLPRILYKTYKKYLRCITLFIIIYNLEDNKTQLTSISKCSGQVYLILNTLTKNPMIRTDLLLAKTKRWCCESPRGKLGRSQTIRTETHHI